MRMIVQRYPSSLYGEDRGELAFEGDQERVLAAIAVSPSGAVSEDSAVWILIVGLTRNP